VANGEIWSVADALRCRAESGCDALMLGRGIVADPGLALALRAHDAGVSQAYAGVPWSAVQPLLHDYWRNVAARVEPRHQAGRIKQWLNLLRRRYPQAEAAFVELRAVTDAARVRAWLEAAMPTRHAGEAAAA
jgi:tRNA-dihydrouridine synthase C